MRPLSASPLAPLPGSPSWSADLAGQGLLQVEGANREPWGGDQDSNVPMDPDQD